MAPQSPIHPWRRPLIRGLGARSSVTGSVFPTDMGYIGASGFASEKYFQRTEPAPERRALIMGVAGPCPTEGDSPRMALACCKVGLDRLLILTAFVADWFRSAAVSRPCRSVHRGSPGDASTVGDWKIRGRREDGRVRRPCPNQRNSSLATRHSPLPDPIRPR